MDKKKKKTFFLPKCFLIWKLFCTFAADFENLSSGGHEINIVMTRKRKQENLDYLLEIEQKMLREGKRLSKTFYGMKKSAEEALATA